MKRKKAQLLGLLGLVLIMEQLLSACSDSGSTLAPAISARPTAPAAPTVAALSSPTTTVAATATTAATTATPAGPPATPSPPPVAPEIKGVTPSAAQVGHYNKFELTIDLKDTYANPFDPAQIDLHATFTSPNGTSRTVPGFY